MEVILLKMLTCIKMSPNKNRALGFRNTKMMDWYKRITQYKMNGLRYGLKQAVIIIAVDKHHQYYSNLPLVNHTL